jgi:hypothetical protein
MLAAWQQDTQLKDKKKDDIYAIQENFGLEKRSPGINCQHSSWKIPYVTRIR